MSIPDATIDEHRSDSERMDRRVDKIVDKLRSHGQRLTPQRMAIIRSFIVRSDHPSVEDIYRDLLQVFPMMAASTVYKTLRMLVVLGEAIEVSPATPEARFDPNTSAHCHLICLKCRAIIDMPLNECALNVSDASIMERYAFKPALHVHQVFGHCAACKEQDSTGD